MTIPEGERVSVHLVAVHGPGGGAFRALLDGKPLLLQDPGGGFGNSPGGADVSLASPHATRLLSLGFEPVSVEPGPHELALRCVRSGELAFDYVWIRRETAE